MKLFLEIAWRNLWRNYQRSLIMIAGIAVGLFGLLVYHGISNGFLNEMVETAIRVELAHLQVYREGYLENPVPSNAFAADSALIGDLAARPGVEMAAPRFKAAVLISSAEKSSRLELVGIDPELEREVTIIAASIDSGAYLESGDTRRIVLGVSLAKNLGVGLGDKVVIMAQDKDNELQSYLFRVAGLFNSGSPTYDKMAAFVTLDAMHSLIGRQGELTSILLRVNESANIDSVVATIRETVIADRASLKVEPWWELSKLLAESIDMFNSFIWIFYAIIYLAMAFGVVNILLMSVIDRTHELGVMRAVGTTPGQIMLMVLLESALLGVVGIAVGGGAGWLVNSYLETNGLDLSLWSSAMGFMGLSNIIYSKIHPSHWVIAFVSAEAAVLVAALWPAWRAARLKPVEAIQFQ